MKKKFIYSAVVLAVLTVGITACGRKETNVATQEQTPAQTEQMPVQTGEATEEPEVSLEEPRDLAEVDESIREQGMLMLQNLELAEYLDESVNLIATEEWFRTMMDGALEGSRNYYAQRDGKTVLTIQAGYDEAEESIVRVCYFGEQVRVLQKKKNAVQLLTAQLQDGRYEGAYEVWTCDGDTGSIYQEKGTFVEGVPSGEYTLKAHEGGETGEIFSLWSNREGMKYTAYTGTYEEQEEILVSEWFWWEHETEGLVKEAEKPADKPAAQKPEQKPEQEPEQKPEQEPEQKPEQKPEQEPEQKPAVEGNTPGSSQPEPDPSQPPAAEQQPSEDNGGNDVDVEWTPDIL